MHVLKEHRICIVLVVGRERTTRPHSTTICASKCSILLVQPFGSQAHHPDAFHIDFTVSHLCSSVRPARGAGHLRGRGGLRGRPSSQYWRVGYPVDPAVGVEEAEVLECVMEELCVIEIEGERPVRVKLMKDRKDRKEIVSFKP
jgi:hypothetical protein